MNAKYLAVAVSVALFLSVGMPIWAGYTVKIAVAAWQAGLVSKEFAPNLGHGLLMSPIMVGCAIAIAYAATMIKQSLTRIKQSLTR